jgi:ribosomal-protein-alanine N-acetyltransferase
VREIRLIPIDAGLSRHLEGGAAGLGILPPETLAIIRGIVEQTLSMPGYASRPAPWRGYLSFDDSAGEVIGACGFKGPPDEGAIVEIAYFTLPPFEGRGYATAMAGALIALAADAGGARRVIAHTLREENASCRVLRKSGLHFLGEVVDPEDGPLWRWGLELNG